MTASKATSCTFVINLYIHNHQDGYAEKKRLADWACDRIRYSHLAWYFHATNSAIINHIHEYGKKIVPI